MGELLRIGRSELLPFDGRWQMTWRVAAQCAIATLVFMTYGIPMAALACYLLLFIMKPDSAETALMAIGITILLSLVVVIMFFLIRWTIEYPILRMTVLIGVSFLFLFLAVASKLGPIGNIIALVVGFIMTLLSDVPLGEVATRGLLYAWLMAATPMAIALIFSMSLGTRSASVVQKKLTQRLQCVRQTLQAGVLPDELNALLLEGNAALDKRLKLIRLFHLAAAREQLFLSRATAASYRLMLAISTQPDALPAQLQARLLLQCELAQKAIEQAGAHEFVFESTGLAWVDAVQSGLQCIAMGAKEDTVCVTPKQGFMLPDAFSNPAYQYFALRTTAAAVICYVIYTALDWQDIHTAMVTCYVAALGSTAQTVHKLFLRIVGCLIGAAMGLASILFLMPYMTSIVSLMALIFSGIAVAGWVAAGSERISYAGIQIGLAFLLTVLQGFGPTMETSAATDRIMGILLGNTVMFLVFTQWWPTSIQDAVRAQFSQSLSSLSALVKTARSRDPASSELSATMVAIQQARESLKMVMFEPRGLRAADTDLNALHQMLDEATRLCRLVSFEYTRATPEYERAVKQLSESEAFLRLSRA